MLILTIKYTQSCRLTAIRRWYTNNDVQVRVYWNKLHHLAPVKDDLTNREQLQTMPGQLQRFCKGRKSGRKSWMHLFWNWRQNYCRRCWQRLARCGSSVVNNANAWQKKWRNFSAPGRPTTNQYYGSKLKNVWLVVVWPLCRMSTGSLVSQTKEKTWEDSLHILWQNRLFQRRVQVVLDVKKQCEVLRSNVTGV